MKLFIWAKSDDDSSGFSDCLQEMMVILANDIEEARSTLIEKRDSSLLSNLKAHNFSKKGYSREKIKANKKNRLSILEKYTAFVTDVLICNSPVILPSGHDRYLGEERINWGAILSRDPTFIVELDKPKIAAILIGCDSDHMG